MCDTAKKLSEIIFTIKKSGMIDFLLIILLLISGVDSIRNGELAVQGQFKYVVSIQEWNIHLCSGTIIDMTHVLTIAHLFLGTFKGELSVVAGAVELLLGSGHPIQVKEVYLHPQLKKLNISGSAGEDWENDIAIIELEERFQPSRDIMPVKRTITKFEWSECQICTMITWDNSRSALNQIWNIVIRLDPQVFVDKFIHVGENQQCFLDEFNRSLIGFEDLGGPIICNESMAGFIVKNAVNGVLGTPSTFLETSAYSEFIDDVLSEGLVDVHLGEFPYIVSIWDDEFYLCGGSILDATHILTTANCVWGHNTAQLKIVAGSTEVSEAHADLSELLVHHIEMNNKYKSWHTTYWKDWYAEHDIAVLVLAKPVSSEPTLKPLDYLNTKDASPGLLCNSFHWKTELDSSGMRFKKLRKAAVKISINESCERALASQGMPVTASQFCAQNQYHIKVADSDDYGNPLICEGKLVGILVKAFPSSDQIIAKAVFLEINPYKEFIHSAITGEKTRVTTPIWGIFMHV